MKQIHITMPDGSIWAVPAEIVAKNCAEYHAEFYSNKGLKEECANAISDSELLDWASNNMNWEDVAQAAFRVIPGRVDYQEGWVNGAKRIVEVKS